jgi:hypothetical protein
MHVGETGSFWRSARVDSSQHAASRRVRLLDRRERNQRTQISYCFGRSVVTRGAIFFALLDSMDECIMFLATDLPSGRLEVWPEELVAPVHPELRITKIANGSWRNTVLRPTLQL